MKIKEEITTKTPEELFQIIHSLQSKLDKTQNKLKEKDIQLSQKNTLIENLENRLQLALRYRYARRSEKLNNNDAQFNLFDEAELPSIEEENETDNKSETVTVPKHERKKPCRQKLPKDLPRDIRIHDLTEEEKQCDCGSTKICFGEEYSEQLEVIPALMYVIKHIKKKYHCKDCEGKIQQAKAPAQAIPKSKAGAGLLAHILVSKFCDHLPLYRQESILKRSGIDISRATLCQWVMRCGDLVLPLINLMRDEILEYPIAYADETTLKVLKEPKRTNHQKSYMWLFGGGPPDKRCWIYRYHPGRHGLYAQQFFEDYKGYIHVDGYSGYHELGNSGATLVGCFAHARRKFFEAASVAKKKKGVAQKALHYIKQLYEIEKEAKDNKLTPDERKKLRHTKSKPILTEFKTWCDEQSQKTLPKSPVGKAILYTRNQWKKLIRYIEDGRLEIDNNRSERSIKPFVIGRKNWLFNDRVKGAESAARIFSLIETCKANKIEPYSYLRYLFKYLPLASTVEEYEKLLPYNCAQEILLKELSHDRETVAKIIASNQNQD